MAISSTNTSFRWSRFHKIGISIIYSKLHKYLWNIYNTVYQTYLLDQWSHPEPVSLRESWFCPRVDENWVLHLCSQNSRRRLYSWEGANEVPHSWQSRLSSHIPVPVDSMHLCQMHAHTGVFLHLTWEKLVQTVMLHQRTSGSKISFRSLMISSESVVS
jgi:hypothetical protein